MLELKKIHFHPSTSEKVILNGVNLNAHFGKPTIIEGSSGSGKTTLLEVISGLSTPQKGLVKWRNNSITAAKRKWLCGVVFQFPERHFLGLTISQELRIGHLRLGNEKQLNVLKKVGLSNINLSQAPEKLSGGQQRRLAIAVQLIKRPGILLLDEPTAGLDWSVREEIVNLLKSLSKELVLIIVTHEKKLLKGLPTCTYKLKDGKLESIL